jgi:uncharacterized surface protein with fasciclin (FAS1) repeats
MITGIALALATGVAACGGASEQMEDPNMAGPPATPAPMPEPAAPVAPVEPPPAEPVAEAPPAKPDLLAMAEQAGEFTTLLAAINAADLATTLKGEGPYTVFAPNDEAFKKVKKADLDAWMKPENKEKLAQMLTYHVVPGKVMAAEVKEMDKKSAKTVNGKEVKVTVKGDDVMLDGKAKILKTDVEAGNGVIHVIDTVLVPPK